MNTRHTVAIALVVTVIAATGVIIVSRLLAQTSSPAVPCEDSDGGVSLAVKGVTKGFHAMDGQYFSAIYGTEPDPGIPKKTTDNFSILYDYCYLSDGVVEGECIDGKLTSYGHNCPYGCSDGVCKPAPADTPPSITLSTQATSPTTWRPGGRGYFSWSVTDDKALQNVVITTSQMMYSGPTIDETWECQGKTSCEEKVYVIVPSNPGLQFVTIAATDSAGQTATKTVNFEASACATDADCGGGSTQWAGASYCGSEAGGLETDIMQYGVAATCKSGGICDTSSLPRVKQKCGAGQVCTFGQNGVNLCIAQATACSVGAQIVSVCTCGNSTYNYPYDWRVATPTYCCAHPAINGGAIFTQGGEPCPQPASSSLVSSRATSSLPPSPSQAAMSGVTIVPSVLPISPATAQPFISTAPSPAAHPAAQPQRIATGGAIQAPIMQVGSMNKVELQREWKLLKERVSTTKKKLASMERNIMSLEKKVDSKLRLLDRSKRKEVQKRVTAQIDQLEKKVVSLEAKKEKLEQELEKLRERWEERKAEME